MLSSLFIALFIFKIHILFLFKCVYFYIPLPSLHERLKVSVGSMSFLILMRASRTIGPHLG